jgi:hypothetical protein
MNDKFFLRLFTLLIILFFPSLKGQEYKKVIVTGVPIQVPLGKIWQIKANENTIVQVRPGTLESNSLCKACLFSKPHVLFYISRNDFVEKTSYFIVSDTLYKIAYTNPFTLGIIPIAFTDKDLDFTYLSDEYINKIGSNNITFFGGERIYVGGCLNSIEVLESEDVTKKSKKLIHDKKSKTDYIQIPIDSSKYVSKEMRYKNIYNNLTKIVLSSTVHIDEVNAKKDTTKENIKIILTRERLTFEIEHRKLVNYRIVNTGTTWLINYRITKYEYDNTIRSEIFTLSNPLGQECCKFYINYNLNDNCYRLIFKDYKRSISIDFGMVNEVSINS